MTLQALLVSKDDETSALLGSVLCEFGLGVQCCGYLDAICRVTEQKFDAVIVDYDDPHSAALVLQNASQASSGNTVVTVALLSDKTKVRSVFGAGANFVLSKLRPVFALPRPYSSANVAALSGFPYKCRLRSRCKTERRWKASCWI